MQAGTGWGNRRRLLFPVLAVAVVLELAVGLVALDHTHHGRPAAAPAAPARTGERPAAAPVRPADRPPLDTIRALLARRASALTHHDRAAFLATVVPGRDIFRSRQAMLFDNLRAVPLADWRYTLTRTDELTLAGTRFAHAPGPLWGAKVTLHYALDGVDTTDTDRLQYLTFVELDRHWYLSSDSDFDSVGQPSWRGLWDYGPVVVARGAHCLVLAHPRYGTALPSFVAAVDAAIPRVSAVWGTDWDQRVAVLIPDTQQEMDRLVGGELDLAHIAAVAAADYADAADHVARGQRVVINPANLTALGTVGRDIVLRHELTHVASRAVTGPATPTWLKEGLADYVGYLTAGEPPRVVARELAGEVAAGTVPATLPADSEFAGDNPRLDQAYEEAWMACRLIAQRAGQAGLVRFYREVGQQGGDPTAAVTAALHDVLGVPYATFVAWWRAALVADLS